MQGHLAMSRPTCEIGTWAQSLLFRRLKLPKGANLHSLRHSHCSHLLASGVPLPAVSARLGHGSIRTTQDIYSHMIHGQDDEAAKKWAGMRLGV
jgi:integrase